jgi:hypothetical protein
MTELYNRPFEWTGRHIVSVTSGYRLRYQLFPKDNILSKAAALVKITSTLGRWFTESSRAGTVVHGNHPISVRSLALVRSFDLNSLSPG